MGRKRQVREHLNRNELLAIAAEHDLSVDDESVVARLVDATASSRHVDLADALGAHSRERLKERCREHQIDDCRQAEGAHC